MSRLPLLASPRGRVKSLGALSIPRQTRLGIGRLQGEEARQHFASQAAVLRSLAM